MTVSLFQGGNCAYKVSKVPLDDGELAGQIWVLEDLLGLLDGHALVLEPLHKCPDAVEMLGEVERSFQPCSSVSKAWLWHGGTCPEAAKALFCLGALTKIFLISQLVGQRLGTHT